MSAAELADRRQRAREAYYDSVSLPESHEPEAFEAAIETATRVRITPEIIETFKRFGHPLPFQPNIMLALQAAFKAAGFEVEE